MRPADRDRRHVLHRVASELAGEFADTFGVETIERFLYESYDLLAAQASIPTFLPVLAGRFARERLRALGQSEGAIVTDTPEVLFVCVHNAGRSQAAAALLDHHARGRVHVRSAGSAPGSEINPAVVAVLAERGIDISKEFPKPLTDEVVRAADVVITMGCGDACPLYPGKRYLDWQLDDPAGKSLDEVRPIVDAIDDRVRGLLAELAGEKLRSAESG